MIQLSARFLQAVTTFALALAVVSPTSLLADDLTADQRAALDRISADSLKGHLSFLSSDLLEGRNTPSRGLDIAAEYIAAQFRRAGLEPAGDEGYFQVANWQVEEADGDSFDCSFRVAGETFRLSPTRMSLSTSRKLDIDRAALVKLDVKDAQGLAALTSNQVEGKAVLVDLPEATRGEGSPVDRRAILARLAALKAALVVRVEKAGGVAASFPAGRPIDPESPGISMRGFSSGPPVLTLADPKIIAAIESLSGPVESSVTLHLGPPVRRPAKLKNVVGLLRGSDPKLKETYVLVTAHYDHVGIGSPVKGDSIYNGANDDGSGTVSVVEVASALASLKERPKRSLVFITFFGEEHGLLGSRYYGRHPRFPVAQTVADVNLEQVGRTDSTEGPQVDKASLTGLDYSDVGAIFEKAGEAEGVKVYKHPRNSDAFFGASDNQALADLGVPAHTLCVAFMYADYHGAADHWDKVDYANMAKIDRVVARSLLMIAENPEAPKWSESNPRSRRYKKARDDSSSK